MDKTCSSESNCTYRFLGEMGFGCNYIGYCDYQRPRDGRMSYIITDPNYFKCCCAGQVGVGNKCMVCGLPKQ